MKCSHLCCTGLKIFFFFACLNPAHLGLSLEAFRLSLHLWVICGAQMHNTRVITSWRQTSLCVVIVWSSIFQTKRKNSQLHLNYYIICYSMAPWASPCPLFWHLCPPASHPANEAGSQLSYLPASSLLSGRQTVEEWAGLWKLIVHALLPGLKMDWNVVYLKHTRLPHRKKDHNTEAIVSDSGNFLERWDMLRWNNLIDTFR